MSIVNERVYPVPAELGVYPKFVEGLSIDPYVLPGMLNDKNAEELAARLLRRSLVHRQWAGVSLTDLFDESELEYSNWELHSYRSGADERALERYTAARRSRRLLGIFTLGIGLLFQAAPTRPAPTVIPIPKSLVFEGGPDVLTQGHTVLAQQNLIARQNFGPEEVVLYPTPALVLTFLRFMEVENDEHSVE